MRSLRRLAIISIAATCTGFSGQSWAACLGSGVQVQILGSGGPGPSAGRGSAGYVIWIDGVGRIMVDAGSGTKDQFQAADASLEDIELIAISHFIHMALFPTSPRRARAVEAHATPSVWGQMATRGDVGRVLVSHIAANFPQQLQAGLDILIDNYSGPVTVGEDLLCLEVG